ncbi:DNA-methyltransferase [Bernardetia sp.]|uniref:DNA-methyltransferase n=1 Tax=Bernardetia sp. TaxID=1937974 RepID=UPI0025BE28F0|nr:site-specific DNA-methyltransferase [Bernardetia sp.]
MKNTFQLYHKSSYILEDIENNSIDALITDPPYGISYQGNYWDKDLPDRKVWEQGFEKLKSGSFGLVFSSIRLMHRLMVDLEDSGFLIKDVLFWAYLNGMPKSRNVGLSIDKELGVESEKIGEYKYVQGYKKEGAESYKASKKEKLAPSSELGKKYDGAGLGIKPSYEPIILIQKPLEKGLNVAQNIIKYGTGALNFEETRIPYKEGESKVGHNPHEKGRVPANIIRTEPFEDGYDKFFLVPKVRQHKDDFNFHPTLKPVELMQHLVKLITFEGQTVLDTFMGSGSTGVACMELKRKFVGYELDENYIEIAKRRIETSISTPKLF